MTAPTSCAISTIHSSSSYLLILRCRYIPSFLHPSGEPPARIAFDALHSTSWFTPIASYFSSSTLLSPSYVVVCTIFLCHGAVVLSHRPSSRLATTAESELPPPPNACPARQHENQSHLNRHGFHLHDATVSPFRCVGDQVREIADPVPRSRPSSGPPVLRSSVPAFDALPTLCGLATSCRSLSSPPLGFPFRLRTDP
jgi:hypothetical protein